MNERSGLCRRGRRAGLGLLLALGCVPLAGAEEVATPQATASTAPPAIYVPPSRGDVRGRVGAAVRGNAQLMALAPKGVGLTTKGLPDLYWHLGAAAGAPVRLEVVRNGEERPLAQLTVDPPIAPGFQRFALADAGIELEPGQVYIWRIVWSKRGLECRVPIERVPADAKLREALRNERGREWAAYAAGGVWYDAIDDLSRRIERAPQNEELRKARASLLRQVGLDLPDS